MLKRNNTIFLIGNGFDINHGLKTSYKDFILDYLKNSFIEAHKANGNYEDDCIKVVYPNTSKFIFDDKLDVKNYIKTAVFESTIITYGNSVRKDLIEVEVKNNFVLYILTECLESDWNGIEDAILRFLKTSHSKLIIEKDSIGLNRKKSELYTIEYDNIKSLNKSVDCIKSKLIDYLIKQNSPKVFKDYLFTRGVEWGQPYTQNQQRDRAENSRRDVLFLNFNYTNYILDKSEIIKRDVGDFYTNFQTLNVHGDLRGNIEDVIFGIGDEQNDFYSEIETLYDDEWLKNMKSFHYFRTKDYSKLLGFIAKGNYEIYILGHSCSITDRTLLNMLFENKYCQKIHVFHYRGMESYLTTAYNIARNFKDKVKLRSVLQPFNENLRMDW